MRKTVSLNKLCVFDDEIILKNSIDEVKNNYRQYDPGSYLYNELFNYNFEDKFSDTFIELVYVTLSAWNMNNRGAKLNNFDSFKASILEHRKLIVRYKDFKIGKDYSIKAFEELNELFLKLNLVEDKKPPLVTFSKALHFMLPDLVVPIDRRYTLTYFSGHTNLPRKIENQFERFLSIQTIYSQFAERHNLTSYIDQNWNRTIPKLLDNMVIGYVRLREIKKNQ